MEQYGEKVFSERANVDLILALAVIHHLAITHDISLDRIAQKFSEMCTYLIIEFPQPDDEKVQIIAKQKENQFKNYTRANFETAFEKYFVRRDSSLITQNNRIIFLYERKD